MGHTDSIGTDATTTRSCRCAVQCREGLSGGALLLTGSWLKAKAKNSLLPTTRPEGRAKNRRVEIRKWSSTAPPMRNYKKPR